jgi:hypothetical protein
LENTQLFVEKKATTARKNSNVRKTDKKEIEITLPFGRYETFGLLVEDF